MQLELMFRNISVNWQAKDSNSATVATLSQERYWPSITNIYRFKAAGDLELHIMFRSYSLRVAFHDWREVSVSEGIFHKTNATPDRVLWKMMSARSCFELLISALNESIRSKEIAPLQRLQYECGVILMLHVYFQKRSRSTRQHVKRRPFRFLLSLSLFHN